MSFNQLKIACLFLLITTIGLIIYIQLNISNSKETTKNTKTKEDVEILLLENNFMEYKAYQEKLFEQYPYYKPSGFVYKETIYNLLNSKIAEIEILIEKIKEDIPELIEWERKDGTTYMSRPTNLTVREDIKKLYKIFPEYTNLECRLRTKSWHGGSASSLDVMLCELYEYDKLINLIKEQLN